ncbi:Nucleoprotein TPR/MLP1 domain-containing protein [Pleurotus pulmonarius]
MSLWKIGAQDVTEEAQAIKDHISSKDSHIAAQETKLMRQAAQLDEIQMALNEALHKLSQETERAIHFETNFLQSSEDLRREKLATQNMERTLASTQEKIKSKELEARELESIIQTLSHKSDTTTTQRTKLEKEKMMLEARVRELESSNRELSQAPPTTTPGRIPRRRSSSVSSARIPGLEQELQSLRAEASVKDRELESAVQRLGRAQEALVKCENEKMAVEKRTSKEIAEMRGELEEKDEEIRYMQAQMGDGSREAQLLARIEEDEAKIAAMERSLRSASAKDTEILRLKRVEAQFLITDREMTAKHLELVAEKEAALNELEAARAEVQRLSSRISEQDTRINELNDQKTDLRQRLDATTTTGDDNTPAHVERLLGAIDRLRGERDDLRRDLEYVEMESKYSIEALEAQLAQAAAAATQPSAPQGNSTSDTLIDEQRQEICRLSKTSAVLSITIAQFQRDIESNATTRAQLEEQLRAKDAILANLEAQLLASTQACQAFEAEKDELHRQSEQQNNDWNKTFEELKASKEKTQEALEEVQARLDDAAQSLEDAESERDSLRLQVTNLNRDLIAAQEELEESEGRYSNLQHHQLDAMTDNEATRALRDQVHELEGRVMRRTEQIGVHQHDIKRLETNLLLHEERLTEMTMEMETLAAQKDAMVEDCASAREARDESLVRIEQLEVEVERLEHQAEQAEGTVIELIAVIVDTVVRSRAAIKASEVCGQQSTDQLTARLELKDGELQELASLHKCTVAQLEEKIESLRQLEDQASASRDDIRSLGVALAISRSEGFRVVNVMKALQDARSQLTAETTVLRDQSQFDALDSNSTSERTALQEKLSTLETSLNDAKAAHQAIVDKLHEEKAELRQRLSDTVAASTATEGAQVGELTTRCEELRGQIQELQKALDEATAEIGTNKLSLETTANERTSLQTQLDDAIKLSDERHAGQVALEQLNSEHVAKISDLEAKLEAATLDLTQQQEEMQALRSQTEAQVELVRRELEKCLQDEQALSATLHTELDDQAKQLDECSVRIRDLEQRIQSEIHTREQDANTHQEAIALVKADKMEVDALLADARHQLEGITSELAMTNGTLESLQTEKESLLIEITTLGAEVQKQLSMHRYMESQAKESERSISSLTTSVQQLRDELSQAEKAAQTSELNLSLQGVQHKREMAEMQRRIAALQSKPNLDSVVHELEERNNEMEELLRAKCAEIEDNDDRVLEMLKDNKKLNSKVEALTRKVNNLQTKLAAAKATQPQAAVEPTSTTPPNISPKENALASSVRGKLPVAGSSTPTESRELASSTRRLRSVTEPYHPPSTTPPMPPMPSQYAVAPSTRVLNRSVSGSSSALPRAKTPERHANPLPVFKARTPEKPSLPVSTEASSSSAGKKRRAPDDFDICENVPPQVFTADSLPSEEPESRTPRTTSRKPLEFIPRISETTNNGEIAVEKPTTELYARQAI